MCILGCVIAFFFSNFSARQQVLTSLREAKLGILAYTYGCKSLINFRDFRKLCIFAGRMSMLLFSFINVFSDLAQSCNSILIVRAPFFFGN